MNIVKIVGFLILAVLWIWLSAALLASGVTLKNLFIVMASAIIIFVPLWKKYVRQDNNDGDNGR